MRSLTSAAQITLASGNGALMLLVDMLFAQPLFLCTAPIAVNWNGHTYLAAGPLGKIDAATDTAGDAQAVTFTLSGVPSENLALALGQSVRNIECYVRLAILNAMTHAIEDVSDVGAYVLDQLTVTEDGATATLSASAQSLARVFARPKPIRYTDGDQQLVFSGDRALEYIVAQSTHQDVWPAAAWGRK